ncbi:MAG: hypothetical protein KME57_02770 [Scytonema hyalinum WJT4-NPBG1]|nr:hypothetical protein [Scytonema hyalinum WJT4-NPBG1]
MASQRYAGGEPLRCRGSPGCSKWRSPALTATGSPVLLALAWHEVP